MFQPGRLGKLSPAHRLRKAALLLTELERTLVGAGTAAELEGAGSVARAIGRTLAGLPETPGDIGELARRCAESSTQDLLRCVDALRHGLFRSGGQDRADWDLLDPAAVRGEGGAMPRRAFLPGIRAWFEDVRSPFNIGSMLRTAEAIGAEEVFLSPGCADPRHPRAFRSAMGAVDFLPWRRVGLEEIVGSGPVFALELGGTPLEDFEFPDRGLVILGSEELGLSRSALERCDLGRVSIPLRGVKASLNVGVAFGILLNAWTGQVAQRLAAATAP
jgi:TrmH family RNA methyltransferase